MGAEKTSRFTVFLLKDTITEYRAALDDDVEVVEYELSDDVDMEGKLFLGKQRIGAPDWVSAVNTVLATRVTNATTAGISALLMVRASGRTFAVTFGHARTMLKPRAITRGFGLRVTINRVDPEKLRSIDSRVYEDLVVNGRKQTSKATGLGSFSVDVSRDLVKAVAGETKDQTYFKHLAGADSIVFSTEHSISNLEELCDELLAAFNETRYREHFSWIDFIQHERDLSILAELDAALIELINARELDGMHLAPTDILDWSEPARFRYTSGGTSKYTELLLEQYLEHHPNPIEDIEQLKRHSISAFRSGAIQSFAKWSVYDSIVCELVLAEKRYVLVDGSWFQIDQQFADQVLAEVNDIPGAGIALPDGINGTGEEDYNISAAASEPVAFALMDRVLFKPVGSASTIEFCDLFHLGRDIIHVKRRSGSAALSHLFSQGTVSADTFLNDAGFRESVAAKLLEMGKTHHAALLSSRPRPSDYRVVFAIISPPSRRWPPPLPFFSAVNLRHHARRIAGLGFRVAMQHIPAV